jgi:hypothetical protein
MTNQVSLTDGSHPVILTIHSKVEADSPAHIAEVPIPSRTTGGQVQFLGSPQWKYSITGILNSRAGVGGAATAHTDDEADFEEGGYLELIKNNTASDCTLTYTYNSVTVHSVTVRITDFVSWPIKGSTMSWYGYSIKAVRKQ